MLQFEFKCTEGVALRCSFKKVLLRFSQNLQENNCARGSFFIKLQSLACDFIKKETLTPILRNFLEPLFS